VDGTGNLFIADYRRVRKVSPDGIIITIAEQTSGPLAADGAGNLFIADTLTNTMVKVGRDHEHGGGRRTGEWEHAGMDWSDSIRLC
jgi:hypothetical protein